VLAQRAVSEDPRRTRAVEDQSAPILEEIVNGPGGIICNLARRSQSESFYMLQVKQIGRENSIEERMGEVDMRSILKERLGIGDGADGEYA
jgi:hypothetical protein